MDVLPFPNKSDKIHLWGMLKENIMKGRLGLVTMALETVDLPQKATELERDRKGNVIRIYCSGGVIEWVWGMMYVFGNKKTKGMVWADAEDKVVIRF